MNKTIALALAATFALGTAQAGAADGVLYPRTIGSGESASIDYGPGLRGNIVGGGVAEINGSGENATVTYRDATQAQEPVWARAVGSGENVSVLHIPVAPTRQTLASVMAARQ